MPRLSVKAYYRRRSLHFHENLFYTLVAILLSIIIIVFTTNMKHLQVESNSHPTAVCLDGAKDFTGRNRHVLRDDPSAQSRRIDPVPETPASVRTVGCDLGFSPDELEETIPRWKRCTVVTFPFVSSRCTILRGGSSRSVTRLRRFGTFLVSRRPGVEVLRFVGGRLLLFWRSDGYSSSQLSITALAETRIRVYTES